MRYVFIMRGSAFHCEKHDNDNAHERAIINWFRLSGTCLFAKRNTLRNKATIFRISTMSPPAVPSWRMFAIRSILFRIFRARGKHEILYRLSVKYFRLLPLLIEEKKAARM